MSNPKRILVSEDTKLWQGIFAKLLGSAGYEVVPALDLKSTLEALEKFFFNVVIVDLALDPRDESRLDGIETMKNIVRLDAGTQAVVLTGKGTVQLAVSSLRDFQVYHFLEKEKFEEKAFLGIIEEASIQAHRSAIAPGHYPPPEGFLGKVEWHKHASQLGLSRNDLESMFCALIREVMPIRFRGPYLVPAIDSNTNCLSVDLWSKWLGRGIRVTVGRHGHLVIPEGLEVIAKHELGKMCGLLVPSGTEYLSYTV